MKTAWFGSRALGIRLAVALLVGCGGAKTGVPMPVGSMALQAEAHAHSWMLPEAKSDDLLYFSQNGPSVFVYSYPEGKLVGTLTGFDYALYECTDAVGNVFVVNTVGSDAGVYEFAHGGSHPINFLPLEDAGACAVDPTTGNLAVIQESGGGIYVYENAQGTPTEYKDTSIYLASGVAYDKSGDLFMDGEYGTPRGFALVELPQRSNTFEDIHFQGTYNADGLEPIVWDGKYLGLGTLEPIEKRHRADRLVVDRMQIVGTTASVVGEAPLGPSNGLHSQWAIHNGIAVDPSNNHNARTASFAYYRYPGGKKLEGIKMPDAYPIAGTAFSVAPSH